jgi:hypothetical protein
MNFVLFYTLHQGVPRKQITPDTLYMKRTYVISKHRVTSQNGLSKVRVTSGENLGILGINLCVRAKCVRPAKQT